MLLFQFCIKHSEGGILEVAYCLQSPLGFGGVEELKIILTNHFSGNLVIGGVPMLAIFINCELQREYGIKESISDSAEFEAGGIESLIRALAFCKAVKIVRCITKYNVEFIGILRDNIFVAKLRDSFRLGGGILNLIKDYHIIARAVSRMNINVNYIFILTVKTIRKYSFEVGGRYFVSVATVVNSLGIFILSGEKGIGNGVSPCKDSFLDERKIPHTWEIKKKERHL